MWQAGFTLPALPMITRMSGLVDILDIHWEPKNNVLIFTVISKSRELFKPDLTQDALRGNPVIAVTLKRSPLLVDLVGVDDTLQI